MTALTFRSVGRVNASNTQFSTDHYVTKKLCIVTTEGNKTRLIQATKSSGLSKH
ncbi:MAG: hypothetical protein ACI9UT_003732 [Flavobacteriales bacterium]|jgi:hypothetical protein